MIKVIVENLEACLLAKDVVVGDEIFRGFSLSNYINKSKRKFGLYMSLPVPNRPWESMSMECVGGFSMMERP